MKRSDLYLILHVLWMIYSAVANHYVMAIIGSGFAVVLGLYGVCLSRTEDRKPVEQPEVHP